MLRVYLVDDEELALRRLERLLRELGSVEIVGSSTDPLLAQQEIELLAPDVLFLDIQMPEMTGFDLLRGLGEQPLVVFTTAYDQYALRAFEVNSIDYLLKPIDEAQLRRALGKLERMAGGESPRPRVDELLAQVKAMLSERSASPKIDRIPSRIGERVHFLDLGQITHFFAEDKLTFAALDGKNWVVDRTISDLEQNLDPARFVRVHRSTLVNLTYVDELYPWFAGKMILRLKDAKKTEITVARDRLKDLKERLGLLEPRSGARSG
jgi:two-component system, LytTR family, response regulator